MTYTVFMDIRERLFVGQQPVKVGDKFNSANGWDFICTREDNHYYYSQGGLSHNPIEEVRHSKEWAYKVIGKVSPDAKWVLAGSTVNANDIRLENHNTVLSHTQICKDCKDESWCFRKGCTKPNIIVLFRCPSSPDHFH